jgi:Xaa-Pro dipeptidase
MLYPTQEEITGRVEKLKKLMAKASLDGAFFHYKIDFYYLSGTMSQRCL